MGKVGKKLEDATKKALTNPIVGGAIGVATGGLALPYVAAGMVGSMMYKKKEEGEEKAKEAKGEYARMVAEESTRASEANRANLLSLRKKLTRTSERAVQGGSQDLSEQTSSIVLG